MPEQVSGTVTRLLQQWNKRDPAALEKLMPLVYRELRRLAGGHLRQERPNHTLQATALVHEAYLRLVDQRHVEWRNRAHFMGVAAQLMRRILVDYARGRGRVKRGGGQAVSLEEAGELAPGRHVDLERLDDALTALAELDARQSRIVELRFFGGLTIEEIAEVLEIAPARVRREWSLARAWLHRELTRGGSVGRS